ncbi:hypothetical protein EJO66_09540 [Variovorax beijingensis]|uniref:ATP-binding protein n=1 Tax=Variovorax beijingensis TaxID=2496117 RepID=A0ABY0A7V7_9BURK|nr:hypothetical protein [Variovorax beijingensis]RSZ38622.1 hypothetical protein EJO66_09540 [Variovorax beijingensis]
MGGKLEKLEQRPPHTIFTRRHEVLDKISQYPSFLAKQVLIFPSNYLAKPLEDFLKKVRQSPGQAMRMPIQLRWGGGLGATAQAIQVIATWACLEDSSRSLRLPESFALQKASRERFGSTVTGMAALYFANEIVCESQPFSRFEALEVMVPRIQAMQTGAYRDTLRGHGAALCCFIGAKNEFLAPLYARPRAGEVREVTDFRVLLTRVLSQLSIRDDALNEGQLDYLSGLLYQLFLNADEHGSFDAAGERYEKGLRGIALRVLTVTDVKSLVEVAGDDAAFKAYLIKQAFTTKAKHPDSAIEQTPFASFRLLEISVFDTGPGLGLRWLSEQSGCRDYSEISHEQELSAVQTCFQKHATTKASQFKGQGLSMALQALKRLNAFMTLRTGRLSLYQDFSRSDTTEFLPKNRFTSLRRPAEIAGTSYSICFKVA